MNGLSQDDFQLELVTPLGQHEAFDAIQRVQEWWMPELAGSNSVIGDEFSVSSPGTEPRALRVAQLVAGRRIVWRVLGGHPREWTGTDLTFELEPVDGGTRVRFIHVGLLPDDDAYAESTVNWTAVVDTVLRRRLGA